MIEAVIPFPLLALLVAKAGLEMGKSTRKWQDKRSHDMAMKAAEMYGGQLPAGPDDYASGDPIMDLIGNGLSKLGGMFGGGGDAGEKGSKPSNDSGDVNNRPEVAARDLRGMGAEPSLQNVIGMVQPRDLSGMGGQAMQGVAGAVQQPSTSGAATAGTQQNMGAPPPGLIGAQPMGAGPIAQPQTNYMPSQPQQGVTGAQESALAATEAPPTMGPSGGVRGEMSMPTAPAQAQPAAQAQPTAQPQQGQTQQAQPEPMVEFDPEQLAPIIGRMAQPSPGRQLPPGAELEIESPFGIKYKQAGPNLPEPARVPQSLQEALTQAIVLGDPAQIEYMGKQFERFDPQNKTLESMWAASFRQNGSDHPVTERLWSMYVAAKAAGASRTNVDVNVPPPGLLERFEAGLSMVDEITPLHNSFKDEYFGKGAGMKKTFDTWFENESPAWNYHVALGRTKAALINKAYGAALSEREYALALESIPDVWDGAPQARAKVARLNKVFLDAAKRSAKMATAIQTGQPIPMNEMVGDVSSPSNRINAAPTQDARSIVRQTMNPDTGKPFTDEEISEMGY